MELNKKLFKLVVGIVFLIGLMNFASAVDDLIALQGNVKQGGADLASGTLVVTIYDAASGGNTVYTETFTDAVVNGKYDVMLGEDGDGNAVLNLEYGKLYYLDKTIGGEDFDYGGAERQVFQAGTGNISLGDLDFSDGQNITLSTGWFKGLFNWVVDSVSSRYISFNGTTLSFNETQLNISIEALGNATYVPYNGASDNVDFGDKNFTTTGIVSGGDLSKFGSATYYWQFDSVSDTYPLLVAYDAAAGNIGGVRNGWVIHPDETANPSLTFYTNDLSQSAVITYYQSGVLDDQLWFAGATNYVFDENITVVNTAKIAKLMINSVNEPSQPLTVTGNANVTGTLYIDGSKNVSNELLKMYNATYESTYNESYESTYNATYDTWAYNMTTPAQEYADANMSVGVLQGILNDTGIYSTYNESYYEEEDDVKFNSVNVTTVLRVGSTLMHASDDGLNITGSSHFNSGWQAGGVSIINGDIFAQRLFVYNITSLAVTHLNINGSLLPQFDNEFDIGSASNRYKDLYLSGDANVSGNLILDENTFFIDSSGNRIGMGTTSPTNGRVLSIQSTGVGEQAAISFKNDSGTETGTIGIAKNADDWFPGSALGDLALRAQDRDVWIGTYQGGDVKFYPDENLAMAITEGGKVGILTDAPTHELNVVGNVNITGALFLGPDSDTVVVTYEFGENNFSGTGNFTTSGHLIAGDIETENLTVNGIVPKDGGNVKVYGVLEADNVTIGDPFTFYESGGNMKLTNGTDNFLTVANTGKVGIGTISPTHELTVTGKVNISSDLVVDGGTFFVNATSENIGIGTDILLRKLNIKSSGPGQITINGTAPTTYGGIAMFNNVADAMYIGVRGSESGSANTSIIYTDAPNGLAFVGDDTYATPDMVIKSDGKVGIATITPTHELNVVGDANITGKIISTGWDSQFGIDAQYWKIEDLDLGASGVYPMFGAYSDGALGNVGVLKDSLIIYDASNTGYPALFFSSDDLTSIGRFDYDDANLLFRISDYLTANKINLDVDGNITGDSLHADYLGIGTTSPTHELNVVGDANVTSNITVGDCVIFTSGGKICSA